MVALLDLIAASACTVPLISSEGSTAEGTPFAMLLPFLLPNADEQVNTLGRLRHCIN